MSDFEKYWEENASKESWANKAVAWSIWKEKQAIIDEHTEVIKLQDADLRKYEKQIESLKAQLNNVEACYIEKKKECEGLQGLINDVEAECKDWHRLSGSGLAVRILEVLRGDSA